MDDPQEDVDEENVAENKLPKEFRGADSMTISEVHCLLSSLVDNKKELDPAYNPSQMLQKTLTYTKRFSNVQSQAAIGQIRKVLADNQLTPFELGAMANLAPGTVEEAKALVPTLEDSDRFTDDELQLMLTDMANFKRLG